jgi:hypothetical protein
MLRLTIYVKDLKKNNERYRTIRSIYVNNKKNCIYFNVNANLCLFNVYFMFILC